MDKVVKIGDIDVGLRANALTPRLYRFKFRRDLIQDMKLLQKTIDEADPESGELDTTVFEHVGYIMAKQFDQEIPSEEEDWLAGLPMFAIYQLMEPIISLWQLNTVTTSKPKKNSSARPRGNRGYFYASVRRTGIVR